MAEITLQSVTPLAGYDQHIGQAHLREVVDLNIVSLAAPAGEKVALNSVLHEHFSLSWPETGSIARNGDSIALLGMQSDQCFMVSRTSQSHPLQTLIQTFGNRAYLTDQSDSWAILELQGSSATQALERICPIDLSESVLNAHTVVRTSMEHISVIVERPSSQLFRLYSPRSSAASFLHAVTLSLNNIQSAVAD